MDLMDETSEIFEDCNNRDVKLEDTKLGENCNESKTNQQQQHEEFIKCNKNNYNNNNNHHVVPVGIVIVLMTIYLGMTSVKKCLVSCVEENTIKAETNPTHQALLSDLYKATDTKNSIFVERFLEYKDICKDLEIFTKNKNLQSNNLAENGRTTYHTLKEFETITDGNAAAVEDSGSSTYMDDTSAREASGSSGSGSCARESRKKFNKKSKYLIKSSPNAKSGFNKYNKSSKAKYNKNNNNKKELNLNKKNSTAEPIIYLFALVFIYLLLKAASDINQHYKSQNKNDKRLRRCSLQSYAQTHRPDRRASKGISPKSLPKF